MTSALFCNLVVVFVLLLFVCLFDYFSCYCLSCIRFFGWDVAMFWVNHNCIENTYWCDWSWQVSIDSLYTAKKAGVLQSKDFCLKIEAHWNGNIELTGHSFIPKICESFFSPPNWLMLAYMNVTAKVAWLQWLRWSVTFGVVEYTEGMVCKIWFGRVH